MTKELEILKLKQMLEDEKIPFEFNDDFFGGYKQPSYQIIVFDKNNQKLCDAIYHFGSYGYEQGLLEIMGGLTAKERENDSVLGHLTANEVFKRFKYCYENNTDTYSEVKDNG